jgi:hypothetical protein
MSAFGELLKQILKPPSLKEDADSEKKNTSSSSKDEKKDDEKEGEHSLALHLYNRSTGSVPAARKKRKSERDAKDELQDREPEFEDSVINSQALNKLVALCEESHSSKYNPYEELWHYLNQELFKSKVSHRMRVLFVINFLMEKCKDFIPIVNANISQIIRTAGLLQSISVQVREKELAKDHSAQLTAYVKELIEYWDYCYGSEFPNLHNIKRYLVETVKSPMPNLQVERTLLNGIFVM